jgi:hypothetical protein
MLPVGDAVPAQAERVSGAYITPSVARFPLRTTRALRESIASEVCQLGRSLENCLSAACRDLAHRWLCLCRPRRVATTPTSCHLSLPRANQTSRATQNCPSSVFAHWNCTRATRRHFHNILSAPFVSCVSSTGFVCQKSRQQGHLHTCLVRRYVFL